MSRLTFGIDLGKNALHIHGIDNKNRVVIAQKVRRAQLLAFFAKLEPSLIGMEARGAAHHWARELTGMGHQVRLMPPACLAPYARPDKNDDAEAICQAVTRPAMRFIPIRTARQGSILTIHTSRALLLRQRTMLVSALRGHLTEIGIVVPPGIEKRADLIAWVLAQDPAELDVPPLAADMAVALARQIDSLTAEIRILEARIREWHQANTASRGLETIPDAGAIHAAERAATAPEVPAVRSERELAARPGPTPRLSAASGPGQSRKAGKRNLRTLLVAGATAIFRRIWDKMQGSLIEWVVKLLLGESARLTTGALANRMAQIAWTFIARGTVYIGALA